MSYMSFWDNGGGASLSPVTKDRKIMSFHPTMGLLDIIFLLKWKTRQ